jgi:hypothetical protein
MTKTQTCKALENGEETAKPVLLLSELTMALPLKAPTLHRLGIPPGPQDKPLRTSLGRVSSHQGQHPLLRPLPSSSPHAQ